MRRSLLIALCLVVSGAFAFVSPRSAPRFFKGNTHTHTLWSDGDAAPELAVSWFKEAGYQFLALTDHNTLQVGERWFRIADEAARDRRLTQARVDGLVEQFGTEQVELRTVDEHGEMRLLTFEQLRERFQSDEFLLMTGEEVTGAFEGAPVHINALNLRTELLTEEGDTLAEVMNATARAIQRHGRETDSPVLGFLNHPSFGWAISWEVLAILDPSMRFFELFNGHPAVNTAGDETRPSLEEMWDLALTRRLDELDLPLLYGLATDDCHNYHTVSEGLSIPGRGWIQVRARKLAPKALVHAMREGNFYSSSGVELTDFGHDARRYWVDAAPVEGETLVTRFIGTRRTGEELGPVGEVLLETADDPAVYEYKGDELYVRAVVISDQAPDRPNVDSRLKKAWVQPVVPPK